MALLIIVIEPTTFSDNSNAIPVVFAMSCAIILIGLNLSINMVCKNYAMIRREMRMGVGAASLVCAKVLNIISMCAILSLIFVLPFVLGSFHRIANVHGAYLYFAVFSTMFTSASLGLLISAVARENLQRAPFAIPFIMMYQLLFSGFVFEQVRDVLGIFTISRYSIRTIGTALRLSPRYGDFVQEPITVHVISNLAILVLFAALALFACWLRLWHIDYRGNGK